MWMTFLSPNWLWLLLVVPIVFYIIYEALKKKKREAMKFSNLAMIKSAAEKSGKRKDVLVYLFILLLVLSILALADPHIPLKQAKEGVNVVIVIDDSGSMAATDYKPTRLEAAKKSAETLIDSLGQKDNIGVVVFESGATTAAYLSPFKDRVKEKLMNIAQKDGRTAIGDGLSLAVDMASSIPNKKKVVILLSDGVNNAGVISPEESINFAKQNKVQVFTVGLGSTDPVVLGYDFFGTPQYAELDETTLKAIAQNTGGEYYKSVDTSTLSRIYQQLSQKIEREREPTSIKDWFIGLIIIILLIELYLRYGKLRVIP